MRSRMFGSDEITVVTVTVTLLKAPLLGERRLRLPLLGSG